MTVGVEDGQTILTVTVGEIAGVGVPFWAPILIALLTGLAIGWLIWGGRSKEPELTAAERVRMKAERARTEPAIDELFTGERLAGDTAQGAYSAGIMPHELEARIADIEQEIADARAELSEKSAETERFEDELNALDSAVNRANGRLRLLVGTVREKLGVAGSVR